MNRPLYEISSAARVDLLHVWNYLAENTSFDLADRILRDIQNAIEKVAKSPGLGHQRPDLAKREVRFYRIHSWLIVFRVVDKRIHVLRVLHASRDIKSLLDLN